MLSPFRMLGYIGHEQNVTWFAPGDLGYLDPKMNGYLRLVGRTKEQIVLRNTKKSNATSIDMAVQQCGKIIEIATVGDRNERGYDDVHIFIRLADRKKFKF